MTECQGCGAWNDATRTLCVLCGTPLAETDEWDATAELPPLPPLPDGGLATSMPDWLRAPPAVADTEAGQAAPGRVMPAGPASPQAVGADHSPTPIHLGPTADPRTFLVDEDFPLWLRELAARDVPSVNREAVPAPPRRAEVAIWPNWPPAAAASERVLVPPVAEAATREPAATPPVVAARPPAAVVAARTREERRGHNVWETVLLVLLFIGVVAAAIWALVSNGILGPG